VADVATLTVRINAATGELVAELKALQSTATQALGNLSTMAVAAGTALGNFATQGVNAAASAAAEFVGDIFELGGTLNDLTAQTGVGAEALQKWGFAAEQSGSSLEAVAAASVKLGQNLATGNETAMKAVKALGLSFKDLEQATPQERFELVAAAIGKIEDPANQAAAAAALLGKAGVDLLPTIQGFEDLTAKAEALGVVISGETLAAAGDFGDLMDVLSAQARAFVAQGLGPILPLLGEVATSITSVVGPALQTFNAILQDPGVTRAIAAIGTEVRAAFGSDSSAVVKTLTGFVIEFARQSIGALSDLVSAWYLLKSVVLGVTAVAIRGIELAALAKSKVTFGETSRLAKEAADAYGAMGASLEKSAGEAYAAAQGQTGLTAALNQTYDALGRAKANLDAGVGSNIIAGTTMRELDAATRGQAGAFDQFNTGADKAKKKVELLLTPLHKMQALMSAVVPTGIAGDWIADAGKLPIEPTRGPFIGTGAPTIPTGDRVRKALDAQEEEARKASLQKWEGYGAQIAQSIMGAIQGGGSVWKAAGSSIGNLAGAELGRSLATKVTTNITGTLGKTLGGALSSTIPVLGAIGGELLGGLIGKVFGPSEHSKVNDMRDGFVSAAGGLHELNVKAHESGVTLDALLNAKTVKAYETAVKNLEAAFALTAKKAHDFAEGLKAAGEKSELISPALLAGLKEIKPGTEGAAAAMQFFKDQTALASGGLDTFLQNAKVTSKESGAALVGALGSVFADLQAQGLSSSEVFAQLQPTITTLAEQLKKAGFDGGAAFNELAAQAQFASDTVAGPLFTAAGGLGDLMVGMSNTGNLTQEMFAGLTKEVTATWKEIEQAGAGGTAGLRNMQKPLQTIYELWKDQGLQIDDTTAELLNFGLQNHIIGEDFRSEQDKSKKAMDLLIERIDKLVKVLTENLPRAAAIGAQGIENELGGIEAPEIVVPYRYEAQNELPDGGSTGGGGGGSVGTMSAPIALAPSALTGAATVSVAVQIDGERIAEAAARYSGRVMTPYGVGVA
jgi:hypothetical protein